MGNFKDVSVIDVLVKPGDAIELETPLVTLETEKATMDVPSTAAGIVERVAVSKGGRVNAGDIVVAVRAEDAEQPAPGAQAQAAAPAAEKAAPPGPSTSDARLSARPTPAPTDGPRGAAAAPARREAAAAATPAGAAPASSARDASVAAAAGLAGIDERGFAHAHASPTVRKFARELGVDLAAVEGTGFKGRITQDDVKAFVKKLLTESGRGAGGAASPAARAAALPQIPAVDFAQFGPTEVKPLSRIQRISGTRLHASWVNIPHVTQFDEADITELENVRASHKQRASERGIRLTPLAFIMRACVKALQQFPQFNASLDAAGENLVLKQYLNVGFAVDTPNGLLVPVVREADRKDVYELARSIGELSERTRGGGLSLAQMQGGCFTISSLGSIGGTAFTPIINAPEVAILGVSRSTTKPVFVENAFVPRLLLPLSLSYDHRVIDGALAVRFTTYLVQVLADAHALVEAVP